jgi:hypothetical protein
MLTESIRSTSLHDHFMWIEDNAKAAVASDPKTFPTVLSAIIKSTGKIVNGYNPALTTQEARKWANRATAYKAMYKKGTTTPRRLDLTPLYPTAQG